MNANLHFSATPAPAQRGAAQAGLPAQDDLDLGFDELVRRFATHRLRSAEAFHDEAPDFDRLIAPPEVTFAAYLADGSVVLCCPDGLPKALTGLAEALTPASPARPGPMPVAALPADLSDKLDALDRKLDSLQRDNLMTEQIADRLESIRATLLDGLNRSIPREDVSNPLPKPADLSQVIARLDDIAEQVATRALPAQPFDLDDLSQALTASEVRIAASIRASGSGGEVAALVRRIEERVQGIAAVLDDLPDVDAMLRRLEDRFDTASQRMTPTGDIVAQRQGTAQFLGAMGVVLRRLDTAVDRMAPPEVPAIDARLASLETLLQGLPNQLQSALDPRPDLAEWVAQLTGMMQDLVRGTQPAPQIGEALQQLAGQVAAIARRPDPVLDLTHQRQSFASFAASLGQIVHRLEGAAETIEAQADLSPILAALETLRTDIEEPRHTRLIEGLSDRIEVLVQRPVQVPDLTQQRQSFAQFATALARGLARIEAVSQRLETPPHQAAEVLSQVEATLAVQKDVAITMQEVLSQAVLGLSVAQATSSGNRPGDPDHAPRQDVPHHLRVRLAEAMALQVKAQAEDPLRKPVHGV